jgi:general stress protein 26
MGKPLTHDLELRRLADLLGDIRCGLLTTIADDGSLWSLPIFTQQASPDGELWLFTRLGSPLANELRRHQRVTVCYAHPAHGRYARVTGSCELLFDEQKASELWDPSYAKLKPAPSSLRILKPLSLLTSWDDRLQCWLKSKAGSEQ